MEEIETNFSRWLFIVFSRLDDGFSPFYFSFFSIVFPGKESVLSHLASWLFVIALVGVGEEWGCREQLL